jgi:hypothetical protein
MGDSLGDRRRGSLNVKTCQPRKANKSDNDSDNEFGEHLDEFL